MKIITTFFLLLVTTFSYAVPKSEEPFVFAVIGDSITRGVWADTAIGNPNRQFFSDLIRAQVIREYFKLTVPLRKGKGDIRNVITNSLNYISREKISAFIGEQDYSLPVRMKQNLGREVLTLSTALLAGTYFDSELQLMTLEKKVKKAGRNPDLILVHLSAIDFVREYSVEDYAHKMQQFFRRLVTSYPSSNIVVTQMVDVVALVTRENVPTFRFPRAEKDTTCDDMYQSMKFGALIGLKSGASEEVIAAGYDRLNSMRDNLRSEVQKIGNNEGVYQNFKGKILIVEGAVAPIDGDWNRILAADCVHPNREGHKLFGGIVWDEIVAEGLLVRSNLGR